MLKVTFFDCTINKSGNTIIAIQKAIDWFKVNGITFDSEIILGDMPLDISNDLEQLSLTFGNYIILSDKFYKSQIEMRLNKDTDICVFLYDSLGNNSINISEQTNVYRMVCAQAIMDNGDPWFYIRHELIHAFHQVLVNSGVLGMVDDQDTKERLAQAYFCADNEVKQQIERDNLIDVKANWNRIKPNNAVGLVKLMKQAVNLISQLIELKKLEQLKENVNNYPIIALSNIIARQEGHYVYESLSQQNNNPGNLVYVGQLKATKGKAGFCYFKDSKDGWTALSQQLLLILNNKSRYFPKDCSIKEFVDSWASTSPIKEREAYYKAIADGFGVDINYQLNKLR